MTVKEFEERRASGTLTNSMKLELAVGEETSKEILIELAKEWNILCKVEGE